MSRAWKVGISVVLLASSFLVLRAVFNADLVKWQATRLWAANQALFQEVATEVRSSGIDRVVHADGKVTVICPGSHSACPLPNNRMKMVLQGLRFDSIYRIGENVYFAKDAGYQYDLGIAQLPEPPIAQTSADEPFFAYDPIMATWYFYRH